MLREPWTSGAWSSSWRSLPCSCIWVGQDRSTDPAVTAVIGRREDIGAAAKGERAGVEPEGPVGYDDGTRPATGESSGAQGFTIDAEEVVGSNPSPPTTEKMQVKGHPCPP
jgi:hypothetical protein